MISVVAITVMIFSLSNECLIGTKKPKLGGGQEKKRRISRVLKRRLPRSLIKGSKLIAGNPLLGKLNYSWSDGFQEMQ